MYCCVRVLFCTVLCDVSFLILGVVRSLAEGGIDKTPKLIIWLQRRPPSLS